MNADFAAYLEMSARGRLEYLQFIIDLADITIKNRNSPKIEASTVEKARQAREMAQRQLEEERSRQRGRQKWGDKER